jgi:hypothetical protein
MKEYCYVIINNAGHSWPALQNADTEGNRAEPSAAVLPQLLQQGWVPIRETPMGGGTSPLAHSLVLLEKIPASAAGSSTEAAPRRARRGRARMA